MDLDEFFGRLGREFTHLALMRHRMTFLIHAERNARRTANADLVSRRSVLIRSDARTPIATVFSLLLR